jgi:hypothetical protein
VSLEKNRSFVVAGKFKMQYVWGEVNVPVLNQATARWMVGSQFSRWPECDESLRVSLRLIPL